MRHSDYELRRKMLMLPLQGLFIALERNAVIPPQINTRILIVGVGFSGAVLARELSENGYRCLVIDERGHLAGNCYTTRRDEGILEHVYGPHIFNTNHSDVVQYVEKWGAWIPFTNRVKAVNRRGIFSFPINLHTINQLFDKQFGPEEAKAFIRDRAVNLGREPKSFEEFALAQLGEEIYETFFLGYTLKQWGIHPKELPASIFKRLPIRYNYNDNYYGTRHQMVPVDGYTPIIEEILNHPLIETKLETSFHRGMEKEFSHTFFSGPLDDYFSDSCGRLGYRTLTFERHTGNGDLLGNGVLNHTDDQYKFTREYEHKYFSPHETHERSVVFREFSKEALKGEIPFYPTRLSPDIDRFRQYEQLATQSSGVTFVGRLGTYRYMDMDQVIGSALDTSRAWLKARSAGQPLPLFAVHRDK